MGSSLFLFAFYHNGRDTGYGSMGRDFIGYNLHIILDRMRKQAERWGAELFQEDVESIDLKNRPFTVQSSERKVMGYFSIKMYE